jgi:putative bacteriocin transport accessory protein
VRRYERKWNILFPPGIKHDTMRKIKPNKTKMEANMKKFIILLLSIFLAMSLAACGNKTDSRDSSGKTEIKDAKELLTTVWNSYEEDEKFAIAGGDMTEENMTEDAPGTFGITDADELDRMLGFPAADAEKIDNAASIMHMMNANTFTCGAYHLKNADDVKSVAADLKENVMGRQWMCGFPDKLVVISVDDYLVSVFGNEELVNTFKDKLTQTYENAKVISEDGIV